MTDPAIDATKSALDGLDIDVDLYRHQPVLSMTDGHIAGCQCMDRVFYRDHEDWGTHLASLVESHMEAAAREALTPLRAIHRPFLRGFGAHIQRTVCNHCLGPVNWPCTTALYLYTSDEIAAAVPSNRKANH